MFETRLNYCDFVWVRGFSWVPLRDLEPRGSEVSGEFWTRSCFWCSVFVSVISCGFVVSGPADQLEPLTHTKSH